MVLDLMNKFLEFYHIQEICGRFFKILWKYISLSKSLIIDEI